MNSSPVAEPQVAKIQKTLTFHDDVARLIQAYADKKGTTFQRVIQAGALEFFFSNTREPDQAWLTAFVELEKGAGDPPLDLARLPVKVYQDYAHSLERKLAALQLRYANTKPKSKEHERCRDEALKSLENAINWAHSEAGVWNTSIELYGGGVDGVIECAIASDTEKTALDHRVERALAETDTDIE